MKKLVYIAALIITCTSCRKDVTLKLPEYNRRVVVEGGIETGSPAVVLLSWSVPYFSDFDYSTPEKAFIKDAFVVASDGILFDTLVPLGTNQGYVYIGHKLIGKEGKTYTLKVSVEGKTYETQTTILTAPKLDSLYFKGELDSLGFIWQRFSEPVGSGHCYRWFSKRLSRDVFYAAPFNSVFDDKFVDGKTFDFAFNRGPQPNQLQEYKDDPERGYYKRGDTVAIKFCRIGTREYDFWYTYYQNKASNSNPFSAPANIKSMFGNYEEAFGAFIGYAPLFDTIIIPKQ